MREAELENKDGFNYAIDLTWGRIVLRTSRIDCSDAIIKLERKRLLCMHQGCESYALAGYQIKNSPYQHQIGSFRYFIPFMQLIKTQEFQFVW